MGFFKKITGDKVRNTTCLDLRGIIELETWILTKIFYEVIQFTKNIALQCLIPNLIFKFFEVET